MEEEMQSVEMMHGDMFAKLSIHCYGYSSTDRGHAHLWSSVAYFDTDMERLGKSNGKGLTGFFKKLHTFLFLPLPWEDFHVGKT